MATNATFASLQQAGFGSFVFPCRSTGSYAFCNLFWRQLSNANFTLPSTTTAPVGILPRCGIPRAGDGRFGNIANLVVCAISIILIIYLSQRASRRRAAVGRIEMRAMLILYAVSLVTQAVTTASILEQGSIPLLVLTAVHAGVVAAFFWTLFATALVATQYVEDGTPSSLIPYYGLAVIFFLVTTYIASDTAFSFTSIFKSSPPRDLKSIGLFILLVLWPLVAVLLYFATMSTIVIRVLGEKKPLLYYVGALVVFIGSQLVYFLLGTPICQGTNQFIDSAFLATALETAAVGILFLAWRDITESDWEDQVYLV